MKILLTGANGFIGKNFIEKYGKKYEVTAPGDDEADFKDIRSAARFFEGKNFDVVIHAAGRAEDGGDSENADNLVMFKNVQYESVLHGVKRLVVVSDMSDLDVTRAFADVTEDGYGFFVPHDGYGLARYLITSLATKDKISTVLRLWNPYGKYCDVRASKTMELIARGVTGRKIARIHNDCDYSAIYVEDALKVIEAAALGNLPRGVYNVASDKPLKELDVARTVKRLAAKDDRLIEIDKQAECELISTCNVSKLQEAMPKLKFTSHTAAIKEVYEHLKKHKSQARDK